MRVIINVLTKLSKKICIHAEHHDATIHLLRHLISRTFKNCISNAHAILFTRFFHHDVLISQSHSLLPTSQWNSPIDVSIPKELRIMMSLPTLYLAIWFFTPLHLRSFFKPRSLTEQQKPLKFYQAPKKDCTPWKINMEHNHGGLEGHFPF